MAAFPELIIDVGHPQQEGLLENFKDDITIALPRFVRDTGLTRRFRFSNKSFALDRRWDDYDVSTATIEAAVGDEDAPPTGGTFDGSYDGVTGGLLAIPYNISAPNLQTLLNNNFNVNADGGVTVSGAAPEFTITHNVVGAFSEFVWDGANLTPSSSAEPITVIPGDASTRMVQLLRLTQRPWAYTSTFTATVAGAVTPTNVVTGSATAKHVHRIAITPEPYGGAFNATFPRQEVTLIGARSNAAATQQWLVTTIADTAGSLASKFFDLVDFTGIARVWLNNGGSAPNTPTGGRLIAVAYTNNDSASVIAGKIITVLDADAAFTSYLYDSVTPKIHVGLASSGAHATGASGAQNSGFTLETLAAGNNGYLAGRYFILNDKDGSVGVWFFVSGETAPVDLAFNRTIQVTLGANNTAAQVATAIDTALSADAQFAAASASGTVVTVPDTTGGPRTSATVGTAIGTSVTRSVQGLLISAQIPYNASAAQVASLLGNNFTVTKTGPFQWDLTSLVAGLQPSFTTASAGLLFPKWYEATLNLNSLALHQRFASETSDELTATFEVRVTFPGKLPLVVLHMDVVVVRNLIDLGSVGFIPDSEVSSLVEVFANEAAVLAATPAFVPRLAFDLANEQWYWGEGTGAGDFISDWTFGSVTTRGGSITTGTNFVAPAAGQLILNEGRITGVEKTITAAGTVGSQTINKMSGSVNLNNTHGSGITVTNSLVTTSSRILATLGTQDTTCKSVSCVAAAGSFVMFPNAAPTAEVRVNFLVIT